jgi:hypothetical protein
LILLSLRRDRRRWIPVMTEPLDSVAALRRSLESTFARPSKMRKGVMIDWAIRWTLTLALRAAGGVAEHGVVNGGRDDRAVGWVTAAHTGGVRRDRPGRPVARHDAERDGCESRQADETDDDSLGEVPSSGRFDLWAGW